ncbi:electron transfer flavoprotein beta subunit/FixA family protein [Sporomusa sp. KB1]|jgi:electron transfer flavoprotein beta subunit|uniref:electron transfer flavoprotein subunit beta/FixA family protein n=1 Tax=Sporomusa sp. KB1 TaxID=943346 RepID=UPI0011A305E9|nr:electron transfer flavoprotein beta subunit/FixA family protein [Sporomusa sp. KB1]TWH46745.1 electron transfer flavoprotein beta subunit [Sporomusa sp. KB1]
MSKVIACYKWVVDEADIRIKSDLSLDISKAKWKISDYDKNAIEAAVQVARTLGGKAATLTFGGANAKQSLKDALSRGPAEGYWINSQLAEAADGFVTVKALAAAINKIANTSLVICAEGSSDVYARQTAPRLGAVLDWPVITSVCKIEINGNTLTAQKKMDDCIETVVVELPAIVAVLPEINEAPLPNLKAVIEAGRKPVTEFTAEDLGTADTKAKVQLQSLKAYIMKRKNITIAEGEASCKVKELVANLKKEGVL